MLVKTYGTEATKPSGLAVVRGCIALNLGGQVAIEEFRPAPSTCDLNHWTTATGRDDMLKKFCRISVYLRSDVVRIPGVEARYEVGEASSMAACDRSSAERPNSD